MLMIKRACSVEASPPFPNLERYSDEFLIHGCSYDAARYFRKRCFDIYSKLLNTMIFGVIWKGRKNWMERVNF